MITTKYRNPCTVVYNRLYYRPNISICQPVVDTSK